MKCTDVSDDAFSITYVASRGAACSFNLTPPPILVTALPRPFDPDRCFVVGENIYWTENRGNAKLEIQAAICDYDMDVLQKTKHAPFVRYPEPTSNNNEDVQERKSSGTGEPDTVVYTNYDAAALHSSNTKSCSKAQLGPATNGQEPWEGLEDGHHGHVVRTSRGPRLDATASTLPRVVVCFINVPTLA
ncbi:uncharacterized protein LOC142570845 [Dermacentor variabilis]|uniref:uncharacterized protein LOC142570845 n=1 Tax=Dermacentor variabilis TaxID=34621 RepID=UPI003F5B9BB1